MALSQNNFQNLNFEAGTLTPIPGDRFQRVRADSALPGWTGYVGGKPIDAVLYDSYYLSSSGAAILDSSYAGGFPGGAIQGNYSALLEAGGDPDQPLLPADFSLSQTGTVPSDARALEFVGRANLDASFSVSLGGVDLSLISSPAATNSTRIYMADVTAFAGSTANLQFTIRSPGLLQFPGELMLDSIEFSSTAVPEPSTWLLLAVGWALGSVYVFRKRHR